VSRRLQQLALGDPVTGLAGDLKGQRSPQLARGRSSSLNPLERWFGVIHDQGNRRGSFDRVRRLERQTTRFIAQWNEHARSFAWTEISADDPRDDPSCFRDFRDAILGDRSE